MSATRRTALITGGLGDLGTAMSQALVDAGYNVAVTYFEATETPDTWLASRRSEGRAIKAFPVDVADFESCAHCASLIRKEIGDVDILVNNAGITRDSRFEQMEKKDWDIVIRTNLDSLFNMTKPFCSAMAARGWGRIINISSVNALRGAFGQANYAAAKAGVHGFTKALALEMATKGVTVNTVSPGYLDSKMVAAIPEHVLKGRVLPQIPVGRLGHPLEIASLVAYICSDDAAFMTGANLSINGGMHMQ